MSKLPRFALLSLTLSYGLLTACQPNTKGSTPPTTTDNPQPQAAPIVIHKARLSPDSSEVLVHLLQSKGTPLKPGEAPTSPNLQQAIQLCQTKDGSCKMVQSWLTYPSSLTSDLWWAPDGKSFLWQQDTNHEESKTSAPTVLNRTTLTDFKTSTVLKGDKVLLGVQGITDQYLYANLGPQIHKISRNTGATADQYQIPMDFYLDLIYQVSPNDRFMQMTMPKAPENKGKQPDFQVKQEQKAEASPPPPPPTDSYFFNLGSKQTQIIPELKDQIFVPAEPGFSPQGTYWASRHDNQVTLYDPKTGLKLTRASLPVSDPITGMFWRNEQVLLMTTATHLYQLTPADGQVNTVAKLPSTEGSFIYMNNADNVYLANPEGLFRLDLNAPDKGWQTQLESPNIGLIFTDLQRRALAVESKEDGSVPIFYLIKGTEQFKLTLKLLPFETQKGQ